MAARRRNGIFDVFTKKKVTYRRDVGAERRSLQKQAVEDRKARLAAKKLTAAEKAQADREAARDLKREEMAERKRKIERKKADAADRAIEKEWREAGRRNPTKKALNSPEYKAGYNLGQRDRGWGSDRRAIAEVKAAFSSKFQYSPGVLGYFVMGYDDGFKKRNPSAAALDREIEAAEISEAWHGKPAALATDYDERVKFHDKLAELARLLELKILVTARKAQAIKFDAKTKLGYTRQNGRQQLYVVGGDQSLDLAALGIPADERDKDLVVIGEVYSITYITAKHHLGKADQTPGPYEHQFGEHGGTPPTLIYDALNKSVSFAGGTYDIKLTDYDGKHSRGILR